MNDFELSIVSGVRAECYKVKGDCDDCEAIRICYKLFDGDSPWMTDTRLSEYLKSHIEEGDTDGI